GRNWRNRDNRRCRGRRRLLGGGGEHRENKTSKNQASIPYHFFFLKVCVHPRSGPKSLELECETGCPPRVAARATHPTAQAPAGQGSARFREARASVHPARWRLRHRRCEGRSGGTAGFH